MLALTVLLGITRVSFYWDETPLREHLKAITSEGPFDMALHGKGQFESVDKRGVQIRA